MNKYELTKETKEFNGRTLYQIKALKDFGNVKKDDLGGWVQGEDNLSQNGNCWVYGNAQVYDDAGVCDNAGVYDNAKVYDNTGVCNNAKVYDNARVYGKAGVCDNAIVYDNAGVYGNARVFGYAVVYDNAKVYDNATVYDNAGVYDDATVYGDATVYDNAKVYDDERVDYNTLFLRLHFNTTILKCSTKIGCMKKSNEDGLKILPKLISMQETKIDGATDDELNSIKPQLPIILEAIKVMVGVE